MMADEISTLLVNYIRHVNQRDHILRSCIDDPYAWEFLKIRVESEDMRGTNDFTCETGSQPENMKKNRYRDILPYDHCRVKITPYCNSMTSDYINASLIKGANNSIGYIATQGPMLETVADFWQMISEFGVKTIIMLCDLFEGAKPKCHQYWPEVGDCVEHAHMTIANTYEEKPQDHFTIRHFTLSVNGRSQKVQQFHYHGWPDHGTPDEIQPVLDFLVSVRSWQTDCDLEPMVVHCSAGCGRSGTFCALDYVAAQLKNKSLPKSFSICELVCDLRRQRIAMVQSKDQYVLLHQAVAQLFKSYLIDEGQYTELELDNLGLESKNENDVDDSEIILLNGCSGDQATTSALSHNESTELSASLASTDSSSFKHPTPVPPLSRARMTALTSSTMQRSHAACSGSCSSSGARSSRGDFDDNDENQDGRLTKNASSSSVFTNNGKSSAACTPPIALLSPDQTCLNLDAFKDESLFVPTAASNSDQNHNHNNIDEVAGDLLDLTLTSADQEVFSSLNSSAGCKADLFDEAAIKSQSTISIINNEPVGFSGQQQQQQSSTASCENNEQLCLNQSKL